MTYVPITLAVNVLPSASVTRPANTTSYPVINSDGQGGVLANTSDSPLLTFANAARGALTGMIFGSKLTRNVKNTQSGIVFRSHIFLSNPSLTLVDRSVYQAAYANNDAYLGYIDHSTGIIGSNVTTLYAMLPNGPIPYKVPSGTSLFGVIEVRGNSAYVPTSGEIFTQTLSLAVD
jgi:hypothetical protein